MDKKREHAPISAKPETFSFLRILPDGTQGPPKKKGQSQKPHTPKLKAKKTKKQKSCL